jgi:hypothetical protein
LRQQVILPIYSQGRGRLPNGLAKMVLRFLRRLLGARTRPRSRAGRCASCSRWTATSSRRACYVSWRAARPPTTTRTASSPLGRAACLSAWPHCGSGTASQGRRQRQRTTSRRRSPTRMGDDRRHRAEARTRRAGGVGLQMREPWPTRCALRRCGRQRRTHEVRTESTEVGNGGRTRCAPCRRKAATTGQCPRRTSAEGGQRPVQLDGLNQMPYHSLRARARQYPLATECSGWLARAAWWCPRTGPGAAQARPWCRRRRRRLAQPRCSARSCCSRCGPCCCSALRRAAPPFSVLLRSLAECVPGVQVHDADGRAGAPGWPGAARGPRRLRARQGRRAGKSARAPYDGPARVRPGAGRGDEPRGRGAPDGGWQQGAHGGGDQHERDVEPQPRSPDAGLHTQTRISEDLLSATDTVSKINLIDLAGSEQQKQSGLAGKQLQEAANINRSLHTLARVVHALSGGASEGVWCSCSRIVRRQVG